MIARLRSVSRGPGVLTLLTALALVLPAVASGSSGINAYATLPSTTQAGSHPDVAFTFAAENRQLLPGNPCGCNDPKQVIVHLPTGLIADPHSTPQCDIVHFSADRCPVDSQVGVNESDLYVTPGGNGPCCDFMAAVYNLIPPPGEAGLFAFKTFLDTPIFIVASTRTNSDYGVDSTITGINHVTPLTYSKTDLWGVPAAPVHDPLRFEFGQVSLGGFFTSQEWLCRPNGQPSDADPATMLEMCPINLAGKVRTTAGENPVSSSSPETPFWQNPTTCGLASLQSSLSVLSYDGGLTEADSPYPATTECSQLSFNPSLFARPTATATDSPSGIDVVLRAPSFESPSVPSSSEIRSTVVTLPPGFSFNANAADGKLACTDAEASFGSTEEARCPEFAKVGTLEIHSAALPGVLPGAVYIGQPKPGERYRLVLTADGYGIHVKLPGTIHPDPVNGGLVTEFRNLPQTPFEEFDLHFFGAEHGVLATPTQCGTYPVTTEFEPWDAALPNRTSIQYFTLDEGPNGTPCPNGQRPFAPSFQAASSSNAGGAHTSFSLDLTRSDGEQDLTALKVATPPGFSASLKSVPYCPEADIAAATAPGYSGLAEQEHPSCPVASLVGESVAGAGAGTHPFYAPGKVYLAGPYEGAPLSIVVITPALQGPYDLGNVVVRAALRVNPETAQVTTEAENLPQIIEGVPLRLRSILVNLNRPNFALNPTDCEPLSVDAKVFGNEGATANLTSPFQVANCAALPFSPRLAFKLSGSTKQAGNPSLSATLTAKPGEANIASTVVTLPHTELIDNAHIQNPCTRVQFAEGHNPGERCPPGSVLGFARAETPLLAKPLEGPIYLRSTGRSGLPDVVAALNGQIDIALDGHVDSVGGRLRTTFETVPDAPISKAVLSFDGGRRGLLENSPTVCAQPLHITVAITGQNGRTANQSPILQTPCPKKKHKRAELRRHRQIGRRGR
jgi:hypothetical protein